MKIFHFLDFGKMCQNLPLHTIVPKVLILGHSFVRRLKDDLDGQFDNSAGKNLPESANVSLYGTGGHTVEKLLKYNLIFVLNFLSQYYITGVWDKRFLPLCS